MFGLQVKQVGGQESPAQRRPRGERFENALADLVEARVDAMLPQRMLQVRQDGLLCLRHRKLQAGPGLGAGRIYECTAWRTGRRLMPRGTWEEAVQSLPNLALSFH